MTDRRCPAAEAGATDAYPSVARELAEQTERQTEALAGLDRILILRDPDRLAWLATIIHAAFPEQDAAENVAVAIDLTRAAERNALVQRVVRDRARRIVRRRGIVPRRRAAHVAPRPRGAGRPACRGTRTAQRSSAASGDSGDPGDGDPPGADARCERCRGTDAPGYSFQHGAVLCASCFERLTPRFATDGTRLGRLRRALRFLRARGFGR